MATPIPKLICYKCGELLNFDYGLDLFFCNTQCGLVRCFTSYKYGSCTHEHCIKFGRIKTDVLKETK